MKIVYLKKVTNRFVVLSGVLLIAVLGLGACTRDFDEINTDPNRPGSATPGLLLGQMQYNMITSANQASRNFTHELMQVDAPRASTSGLGVHRYVINPGSGVWNNFYANLTDIADIDTISTRLNEPNYRAIGLVYKCWAYSILTDLHGDIPYSEASKATKGNVRPAFDKQKDIYVQILQDLQTANSLFDDTKPIIYGGDLVYGSKVSLAANERNIGIQKWKKFANSLRLRLLLRLSKREGEVNVREQITAILANPATYPVFTSNTDEAIFRYPGTFPYFNPYYNARPLDWQQSTYYTEFFINYLNQTGDPRRAIWATTVNVNGTPAYRGIQSSYPTTLEYVVGQNSSYSDALRTLPQLGVMMTLAEVEFIKAELALKGYNTGKTPKEHYEAGIAASIVQWGANMPAGFLGREGVAYNAAASEEQQLEQIILQKYYAYFFVDYQSWFEKRRTGYPVLPRGAGIPAENTFPSRLPYPTYLQSLNPEGLANAVNSIGGDRPNVKVWWEQ